MSEKTYVIVSVGGAALVALAAIVASRRAAAVDSEPVPQVLVDDALEEISVTARRLSATVDVNTPRGIRNNNPGNLIYLERNAYLGQVARDGALGVYDTKHNGIRASALELKNDYTRKGLRTIDALITEWAPPHENPTVAYINAVARAVNAPPNRDLPLNRATWIKLLRAVFRQENGNAADGAYSTAEIELALIDAGVPA